MKYNIYLFLSLFNLNYLFNGIQATEQSNDQTILNILKVNNEILKLRLENLELKQSIHFEVLHKKINTLGDHIQQLHRSLPKPPERVDNVITTFLGNEEPQVCIKDVINEKLICSNLTLPARCDTSNSMNCYHNKCRIQNRLMGSQTFLIDCVDRDGTTGWTTIQRRIDQSVDFHRDWIEYKNGFGDIDGNYWIGLEKLHALTTLWAPTEILFVLDDFSNVTKMSKYDSFLIGDESTNYAIKMLGSFTGTAGDSFTAHKGSPFTTFDRDNDNLPLRNCAGTRGGWWYTACFSCNLNGKYFENGTQPIHGHHDGIHWDKFRGINYSLKTSEILIRPKPT